MCMLKLYEVRLRSLDCKRDGVLCNTSVIIKMQIKPYFQFVIAGMSSEFVADKDCRNLFLYARVTMQKPVILAVLGTGSFDDWRQSPEIGPYIANEVRID